MRRGNDTSIQKAADASQYLEALTYEEKAPDESTLSAGRSSRKSVETDDQMSVKRRKGDREGGVDGYGAVPSHTDGEGVILGSESSVAIVQGSHSNSQEDMDNDIMTLLLPGGFSGLEDRSHLKQSPVVDQSMCSLDAAKDTESEMCSISQNNSQLNSLDGGLLQGMLIPANAASVAASRVRVQNVIASARVAVESCRSGILDLRRIAISCRLAEYNPRKINSCIIRLRKPKCTGLIFSSGRLMVTGAESEESALRAARLIVRMLQAVLQPQSAATMAIPDGSTLCDGETEANKSKMNHLPSANQTSAASAASETQAEEFSCKETPRVFDCRQSVDEIPDTLVLASSQAQMTSSRRNIRKPDVSKIRLTQFSVENIVATADCGLPVRLEGLAFDHKEFCSYEPELFAGLVYRYSPTPSLNAVLLIFVSGKVVITGCKTATEIQEVFDSFFPVLLKYHT